MTELTDRVNETNLARIKEYKKIGAALGSFISMWGTMLAGAIYCEVTDQPFSDEVAAMSTFIGTTGIGALVGYVAGSLRARYKNRHEIIEEKPIKFEYGPDTDNPSWSI